jgi:hypothetical protein
MKSKEIQDIIYEWALRKNFTAPYGVLSGAHVNKKGRKYLSVTFGRARTLDCSVDIYNKNFILIYTNRHGSQVFKTVESAQEFLETL